MARMPEEELPRPVLAFAILLADIFGGPSNIGLLNAMGQTNKVTAAFELADEFIKQSKEKS